MTSPKNNGILLVSELFPPDVGGSPELFGNVYSRLSDVDTAVLTEPAPSDETRPYSERLHVVERAMRTAQWGLLHLTGLSNHLKVAGAIRTLTRHGIAAVHCG